MAAYEKVAYFMIAFGLYAATILTALQSKNILPVQMAIVLGLLETFHWGHTLKHKNVSMFWALMVVSATVLLIIRLSGM